VPTRLKRYYGARDLHFITRTCYHRLPVLGTARRRDCFLKILQETQQRYQFVVYGYVIMPEHFHLLISEQGDPSVVMKVLKQSFARKLRQGRWRSMSVYAMDAHDAYPVQLTISSCASQKGTWQALTWNAEDNGRKIGSVTLRVSECCQQRPAAVEQSNEHHQRPSDLSGPICRLGSAIQ